MLKKESKNSTKNDVFGYHCSAILTSVRVLLFGEFSQQYLRTCWEFAFLKIYRVFMKSITNKYQCASSG